MMTSSEQKVDDLATEQQPHYIHARTIFILYWCGTRIILSLSHRFHAEGPRVVQALELRG